MVALRRSTAPAYSSSRRYITSRVFSVRFIWPTTWPTASVLQIAPTVADLVGVEPDPGWTGTSLLGAERALVDVVFDLLASMAAESYGERVTMLDHSLQSAAAARAAGEGTQMVLACLLHES